jgi:RNA polymerase sigma-70 factor (ECF subfamily)
MTIQEINKKYRLAIIRYLSLYTGDLYEAEDLTQKVFLKVYNALDSFKGDSKFSTWLYKIASNVAIDYSRSSSYKKNNKLVSISSVNDIAISESNLSQKKVLTPEQLLITNEMNDCIQRHINRLNSNYKIIILLADFQGLKNKEIAKVLDLSLEAVKIRLLRARKKLKELMNNGCEVYSNNGELGCNEK